ncbi:unnamed protein product [Amoebophrya sp. A25]|nr:unnamed protein product [Amoebophrya sp. A25]|eukprot:GSA25T00025573001.1
MLYGVAEAAPQVVSLEPCCLEVLSMEVADMFVPEFRKIYEAKFRANGYTVGQFVFALHELMRRDIRLLDYKTARLDRLHRIFLDEVKAQLEGLQALVCSHLDEAHMRVLLAIIMGERSDASLKKAIDLTTLIFPLRGTVSEICHQAGLAPQMKPAVLRRYLATCSLMIRKCLDRQATLEKEKARHYTYRLKLVVDRLLRECQEQEELISAGASADKPDPDDYGVMKPAIDYMHTLRIQLFEDSGALRESFYAKIRSEEQYLVPGYCEELFQEALGTLYPENLLR